APTLLLLTFLGGARKVSGCRAAPGAPLRPEKDRNQASTSACSKTRLPTLPTTSAREAQQTTLGSCFRRDDGLNGKLSPDIGRIGRIGHIVDVVNNSSIRHTQDKKQEHSNRITAA
ncbi:hypothetical protein J8I26_20860, partial [Herbaspirillum sp. LeCh32-8]|uniref:hypothetical protein n=1 Tax=Herbaspirillum sp. LeCh32-8 TaxID=2821356 RepID=UPI001AE547AA